METDVCNFVMYIHVYTLCKDILVANIYINVSSLQIVHLDALLPVMALYRADLEFSVGGCKL